MTLTRWNLPGTTTSDALVNTTTANLQNLESISALRDGGWVVLWQDASGAVPRIRFQVFNADGTARSSEGTVAPPPPTYAVDYGIFGSPTAQITWLGDTLPSVTGLDNGGFAVTWQRNVS
jgi:trimeric autotransporter adhesin